MVKGRKDAQINDNGKGIFRFRYMDSNRQFEVEADNVSGENLLEGFRHVANAITGRNIAPAPKLLKNASGSAPGEVLNEKDEIEAQDVLPFEETPGPDPAEVEEPQTIEATAKPKHLRKPKRPSVLDDPKLNIAAVSLADFMAQKGNPSEMFDKISVVAVWYKQQFKIAEIDIDRIYTAFKHAGWDSQLPTDIQKPLNNLTYNKKWFSKSKTPGAFEINWVGEDAVNKMGTAAKSATA